MSEARLFKFRFKPDGKEKWLAWAEQLKRRSHEVFETLRSEGVILEACFVSPEEDAIYYFVGAESLGAGLTSREAQRVRHRPRAHAGQGRSAHARCRPAVPLLLRQSPRVI